MPRGEHVFWYSKLCNYHVTPLDCKLVSTDWGHELPVAWSPPGAMFGMNPPVFAFKRAIVVVPPGVFWAVFSSKKIQPLVGVTKRFLNGTTWRLQNTIAYSALWLPVHPVFFFRIDCGFWNFFGDRRDPNTLNPTPKTLRLKTLEYCKP